MVNNKHLEPIDTKAETRSHEGTKSRSFFVKEPIYEKCFQPLEPFELIEPLKPFSLGREITKNVLRI